MGRTENFSTLSLVARILSSQPYSILQVILYPRVCAMYGDIIYLFPYLSVVYLMTPLVAQIRVVELHVDWCINKIESGRRRQLSKI